MAKQAKRATPQYDPQLQAVRVQIFMVARRSFMPRALISAVKYGIVLSLRTTIPDFERTVATWNKKPTFSVMPNKLAIKHTGKIYGWLNFGARRFVRVERNFIAKTEQGWIGSRAGAGDIIRMPGKKRPRFFRPYQAEGRGWSQAILEKMVRRGILKANIRFAIGMRFDKIFPPRKRMPRAPKW